jgi:hypothetical protein
MKQIVTLQAVLSLALLVCAEQSFAFQVAKTISSASSSSSAGVLTLTAQEQAFQKTIEDLAQREGVANNLSAEDLNMLKGFLTAHMNSAVARCRNAYQAHVKGASLALRAINYFKPCSIVTVEKQNEMKQLAIAELVNSAGDTIEKFCKEHAVAIFDAYVASTPVQSAASAFGKNWAKFTKKTTIATAVTAVATVATAVLVYKTGAYKKLSFKATPKRA